MRSNFIPLRLLIILSVISLIIHALSVNNDAKYIKLMEKKLGDKQLMQHYSGYRLYKRKYNKRDYGINLEYRRFTAYLKNMKEIEQHNERYESGQETYELAINHFADMVKNFKLPEEFNKLYGFRLKETKRNDLKNVVRMKISGPLPRKVDWRTAGAVTKVKNQGNCGSCWAFSAVGALEGQHFLRTGKLIELSEQNILDCSDFTYGNHGCHGGFMMGAFEYVADNDGIDTEKSYPYEAEQHICRYLNTTRGTTAYADKMLPHGDELQLKAAVAMIGPISVGFDASWTPFYKRGIFSSSRCTQNINHGVLAVGYGTDEVRFRNGTKKMMDYWLIKNSWGTQWGINGYLKLARNQNMCGIGYYSCYPSVSSKIN